MKFLAVASAIAVMGWIGYRATEQPQAHASKCRTIRYQSGEQGNGPFGPLPVYAEKVVCQ